MRMFALKVEQTYLDCPYHNKAHAATVTLMLFQIILHSGMVKQLKTDKIGDVPMTLYIFAAIIAASIHDLHHPGVGSDFRVRTVSKTTVSVKSKDKTLLLQQQGSREFWCFIDNLQSSSANSQTQSREGLIWSVLQSTDSIDMLKY